MSRSWCRLKPADEHILVPVHVTCPECGRAMRGICQSKSGSHHRTSIITTGKAE